MADLALKHAIAGGPIRDVSAWDRLKVNRDWLGLWFVLPAAAFLLLFLAYPLGLGVWLSFTDARIGRVGAFVGLENYEWLWDDSVFWLSVFNTLLYTGVASVFKFAIGLYLALLLNQHMPFNAITLLAGLQTVSPSLYEAATIDGASRWQMFRYVTYPLLTPIIAVVMTFSVLFTFTDFQLIWVLTRGGPVNATHLMATLGYQRAIGGGYLGEGSAIATAMIPFLLAAILISWFGLQRRKWQHGESND